MQSLDWKEKIDISLAKAKEQDVWERFKYIFPTFGEVGFFQHLIDWNQDNILQFHAVLRYMANDSAGLGIAVSAMAMANLCGNILKISNRMSELDDLVNCRKIYSFAVSEKGWMGRLKNIQSSVERKEDICILSGKKGYATTAGSADRFIVVLRDIDARAFPVFILERNTKGLEILPYDMNFAREATHAELVLNDIQLNKDSELNFQYSIHAKHLRILEIFSLHSILLGFTDRILSDYAKNQGENIQRLSDDLISAVANLDSIIQDKIQKLANLGMESLSMDDMSLGKNVINLLTKQSELLDLYPDLKLFQMLALARA